MSNARLRGSMKLPYGVLLNETTVSDDANVQFGSSLITDDYDLYDVYVKDLIPATDNTQLKLQLGVGGSIDNGNNYSITYKMVGTNASDAFEATSANAAATNRFNLTVASTQSMGTGTGESWTGRYRLYNLRSTTFFKGFQGLDSGGVTSSEYFSITRAAQAVGKYNNNRTNKVDTIKVFSSSGNLASGTISLYGIKT